MKLYLRRPTLVPDAFTATVIGLVLKIPRGRVATYGQLAELAGSAGRSRSVGFILRTVINVERVPWHRVLAAPGRISIPRRNVKHRAQRKRLEREGVVFTGERVDLDKYRWRPPGPARPRMFAY